MKVISLSVKSSGPTPCIHQPLAIGAVAFDTDQINANGDEYIEESDSYYIQLEWDSVNMDATTMTENQLDIFTPPGPDGPQHHRSFKSEKALEEFHSWLLRLGESQYYALGTNVGFFDLSMLKSVWTYQWPFYDMSIDLDSIFTCMSLIQNRTYYSIRQKIISRAWVSVKNIYPDAVRHNALYNAWLNTYAFWKCIRRIQQAF